MKRLESFCGWYADRVALTPERCGGLRARMSCVDRRPRCRGCPAANQVSSRLDNVLQGPAAHRRPRGPSRSQPRRRRNKHRQWI